MNKDDLTAAAGKVGVELEKGADWLAQAGIKSPYGWAIYLGFLAGGMVLEHFLRI